MLDDILIGAKVKWVADRINALATIQPRHIGRVTTFTHVLNADDYSSVMGRLDGYSGNELIVSGEVYGYGQVADLKIWRQELA